MGLIEAGNALLGGVGDLYVSSGGVIELSVLALAVREHDKLVSGDPLQEATFGLDMAPFVFPMARVFTVARTAQIAAEGGTDLALGLTRSERTGQMLLRPFAESLPGDVRTWGDEPFASIGSKLRRSGASWEKANEAIIDHAVASGGKIHFNLVELDRARGGLTASELDYVCSNPVIRAATQFYGAPAPC